MVNTRALTPSTKGRQSSARVNRDTFREIENAVFKDLL